MYDIRICTLNVPNVKNFQTNTFLYRVLVKFLQKGKMSIIKLKKTTFMAFVDKDETKMLLTHLRISANNCFLQIF